MKNFEELLKKQEELCEELQNHLTEGPLGMMIAHPLLHEIFYAEGMNAVFNERLKLKKQYLDEQIEKKKWSSAVWMYERPYRLQAFLTIKKHLSFSEYWELLGSLWTDSENIWQNQSDWKKLLSSSISKKECFMDEEERKRLKSLPELVTVYRGYVPGKNKSGFSYTLSKKQALWFAKRYDKSGKVLTRQIKKSEIFAFKTHRGEEEVIILSSP